MKVTNAPNPDTNCSQNLVRELESFLNKNNQTPEDHWRSRILLRSAEEADQDILIQIQQHSHRHFADPTVRASFGKLHCDFKRAHTTLRKILMKCKDRQGTDLSSLPTKRDTSTSLRQQRAVEEDFFDRTTREREREKLAKINTAMQQVHEIYNDLALLVTHQKEDGNQIEETIDCSNVVADLENQPLQRTKNRMARFACGGGGGSAYDEVLNRSHEYSLDPKNGSKRQRSGVLVCGDLDDSVSHNDATDTETDSSIQSSRYRRSSTKGKRRARRDSSSTTEEPGSSWIFSCNTIQNDFIDVQKDLLGFVVSDFIAKNTKDLLICGSSNDVAND